jgi:Na+:H+ antiporter, NhaA family
MRFIRMEKMKTSTALPQLPRTAVDRLIDPLTRYIHVEAASGVVLLTCTIVALALANSRAAAAFAALWSIPVVIAMGAFSFGLPLQTWINDGLMAIFFFVVGLEVKREIVHGQLRDLRSAALPIAAAVGGMVVPAAIYLLLQWRQPGQHGWGIPAATDIAFVVGCLAILGRRVPQSLRILLLTLAIADDVGAILVIAVGYTRELHLGALLWAAAALAVIKSLTFAGIRSVGLYIGLGAAVWFGFHESGVHATIAGVVLGLMTPADAWVPHGQLAAFTRRAADLMEGQTPHDADERRTVLRRMERAAREGVSPAERLEAALHPWVSFIIMPLFALANAGVSIDFAALAHPVSLAVAGALLLGKPAGIFSFSWLAVRLGIARLPRSINWPTLAAGGVLAGIGFTMSLFVAGLALDDELLAAAKVGILVGSALSATLAMALLINLRPRTAETRRAHR